VKDNKRWTVAVDGTPWAEKFDNTWDPFFSPDSNTIIAKAERNGKFYLVIDGKISKKGYEYLWNPVFNSDGKKLLIRCVDGGKYYRRVVPINEL
jgi:Tol biopolymer transport system component